VSSGATTNGGVPGNVSLAADVSTTGTVIVRATGGAITHAGGTVTATSLALVAASGVIMSTANDSATLAGSVSAAGAAFSYTDVNALTVGTAGGVTGITTNGGNVQLSVGGNLTVAAAVDAGTATVSFIANASFLSYINQSSVGSSGGNITSRFDDYDLQAGSSITTAANREVNLRVATGGVGIDLGSTGTGAAFSQAEIDTVTAGQLRFTAAAIINILSSVTFNPAKVATVVLEAVSGILDATAAEQTDLAATNLAIKTSTGIGAFDDLDTAVSVLAFRNITSGNVNISNTGALTIGSVFDVTTSTNSGGTTTITASSPLTFAVNTTSAGDATYTAGESSDAPAGADDLTINAGVTVSVTTGTLTLRAGDDIVVNGVTGAFGAVSVTAAFNDLDGLGGIVNNGLIESTGAGVDIHAIGNISVGRVSAASAADLTTTAGAIIDSNATGADITASSVSLSAATGIGSAGGANAISTEAATLTAANSTSGNINIIEATGIDLAGITNSASGGNVSIATLAGSITTSAAIVATGAGNIALATAGAGSTLTLSNTVTTGSGTADLTADAMALTAAITGSGVALRNTTVGQGIDLGGADAAGTLGLTSAELNAITATGGTLTIGRNDASASGNITISSAIAPAGASTLVLRTGGAITQTAGMVTANLALVAATGVVLTNAGNDAGTLAGAVSGAGAAFSYTDANALTVGTAGGVTGITTNNGAVTLTAGAIAVSAALSTTAAVTLNASGTTFGVALGGIGSLTTDAAGTTAINGGAVTTTGAQTYHDAVTLGGATTLTSTGGGAAHSSGSPRARSCVSADTRSWCPITAATATTWC
jgi:hypothetical protein